MPTSMTLLGHATPDSGLLATRVAVVRAIVEPEAEDPRSDEMDNSTGAATLLEASRVKATVVATVTAGVRPAALLVRPAAVASSRILGLATESSRARRSALA